MIRNRLAASLALIAVLGTTVLASPEAATRAYTEGKQKYAAGNYAGAAVDFRIAYAADRDPAYLFNLAQALRLAKACDEAAQSYRTFLAEVPDVGNRAEIEGYLRDLDRCVAEQKAAPPTTVPAPTPAPREEAPPTIDAPPRPRSKTLPLMLGVAGIVALGAGAYFAHDASVAEDDYGRVCTEPGCVWGPEHDAQLADLDERGKRSETLGISMLAVGGAAVIAGVVLWLRPTRTTRSSAVTVVPTREGALAVGTLRF
ncbi:MAG: hypothetical protein SFX73_33875 [Kofleriaceae bacterium]|nr:hypothetical protein [Kofleriaceae bacterium]